MYQEITTDTLTHLIQSGADITLIDVREQDEWDQIRLPQAILIPLSTIEHRVAEIDFSKPVYIFCRTGGRSANVCTWLESQWKSATNVAGSIKKLYQDGSDLLEITDRFSPTYLA